MKLRGKQVLVEIFEKNVLWMLFTVYILTQETSTTTTVRQAKIFAVELYLFTKQVLCGQICLFFSGLLFGLI